MEKIYLDEDIRTAKFISNTMYHTRYLDIIVLVFRILHFSKNCQNGFKLDFRHLFGAGGVSSKRHHWCEWYWRHHTVTNPWRLRRCAHHTCIITVPESCSHGHHNSSEGNHVCNFSCLSYNTLIVCIDFYVYLFFWLYSF